MGGVVVARARKAYLQWHGPEYLTCNLEAWMFVGRTLLFLSFLLLLMDLKGYISLPS
jgi:hypothetical protein